jgi:hypothetical protein
MLRRRTFACFGREQPSMVLIPSPQFDLNPREGVHRKDHSPALPIRGHSLHPSKDPPSVLHSTPCTTILENKATLGHHRTFGRCHPLAI